MKNFRKLFGVIFVAAIIAGTMAACELFPQPNQTPVYGDYDISNLTQFAGSVTAVRITPKAGKSSGARTIYYAGIGGMAYEKNTAVPTAVGSYAVTFDVAAADGWNAATGLSAGVLTVGTPTPVASDYVITGLAQTYGIVTAVSITPKAGKSSGARTIYYTGIDNTTYAKSVTLPTAMGNYAVTFDVAASGGWNPATGLSAGTLDINDNKTPVASDYEFGKLTQTAGSASAVSITPKSGKSSGVRTIYYAGTSGTIYAKSEAIPTAVGNYAVTFDVDAATGWNPATGLSAGTLVLNTIPTPVASHYVITGLVQTYGIVTAVTITPKADKSSGARTIYYEGISGTTYAKSTALPTTAKGTYAVTFDVAAVTGWNAGTGLSAGNLVINDNKTPKASDYSFGNLTQPMGSVTAVTITRNNSDDAVTSKGTITIYYEGTGGTTYAKSKTLPSAAGTYAVTFDVAAATGWNAVTGLSAGTLAIGTYQTPVAADYDIGNLKQAVGRVTAVSITPKPGKSSGARTIYYTGTGGTTYSKSQTLPTAAGTYAVTFDVAAASGWNAATGLSAGGLIIAGTLTITNIPSKYNGEYAVFGGIYISSHPSESPDLIGIDVSTGSSSPVLISNEKVILPVWKRSDNDSFVGYSGNDKVMGRIEIYREGLFQFELLDIIFLDSIQFTNGCATKSYNDAADIVSDIGKGEGTLTVTGIPLEYNGKYATFYGKFNPNRDNVNLMGIKGFTASTQLYTLAPISGGEVSLPVWMILFYGCVGYSGNDTVEGMIAISSSEEVESGDETPPVAQRYFASIQFSGGIASISWDDGSEEGGGGEASGEAGGGPILPPSPSIKR